MTSASSPSLTLTSCIISTRQGKTRHQGKARQDKHQDKKEDNKRDIL